MTDYDVLLKTTFEVWARKRHFDLTELSPHIVDNLGDDINHYQHPDTTLVFTCFRAGFNAADALLPGFYEGLEVD
ncbi:hypothetical protein [Candidatus Sodalis sp. SoCistrobi]|uniref:hypothetical protein n=1 Tax=Candidatus Sodalis sp. SoCistrobi TaxID=1922216 RepID=UPI000939F873|nr:hypothetical protein [Candidatus Sodalis sp. SoCistrobi]